MTLTVEFAAEKLAHTCQTFPTPMETEVTVTAMVVGSSCILGMLYIHTRAAHLTKLMVTGFLCALIAGVAMLALGNASIRNRDKAEATAETNVAGDCRQVRQAATENPDSVSELAPTALKLIKTVCDPSTLTMLSLGRGPDEAPSALK